jgi:hypothetical protein
MQFARPGVFTIDSAKTRKRCLIRIMVACSLAFPLAGCSRHEAPDDTVAEEAAADAAAEEGAPGSSGAVPPTPLDAWRPDEERESLPSSRIYYTLTDYAWYAHGEPLLHEGRPHVPVGLPIAASVEEMEKVGEYEGVDYYTRRNDSEPVLYVPVFEGYWLTFRLSTIGAAKVAKSAAQ